MCYGFLVAAACALVAIFTFGWYIGHAVGKVDGEAEFAENWSKFYRSKRYKRNCNRFANETDAWNAFVDERHYNGELEDDKFVPTEYVYWLFEEKK